MLVIVPNYLKDKFDEYSDRFTDDTINIIDTTYQENDKKLTKLNHSYFETLIQVLPTIPNDSKDEVSNMMLYKNNSIRTFGGAFIYKSKKIVIILDKNHKLVDDFINYDCQLEKLLHKHELLELDESFVSCDFIDDIETFDFTNPYLIVFI